MASLLCFVAGLILGMLVVTPLAYGRGYARANREWIDQPEWNAIRLTSWGAWLHRLAREKRE